MCPVRIKLDLGDCRPVFQFMMSEKSLHLVESELRAGNIEYVELFQGSAWCRFRKR